jgi:osmotically-inducible protein OsmY
MRTDADIERDVKAELHWSPELDDTDIAVKVKGGVVALTGFVGSLPEKHRAESATTRVAGVSGLANDVQVRVADFDTRSDPELAREAVAAVRAALPVVSDKVKVLVEDGRVTLEGTLEWQFQRESAERALHPLRGIRSIENFIQLVPQVSPGDIQKKIKQAFHRSAQVDAQSITVDADGAEVTLRGQVHSWSEREAAQRTAWSAPGVKQVTNLIAVVP